jgi:hypothetical protein
MSALAASPILQERIIEAVRCAGPHLPPALRAELEALLTPEAIALLCTLTSAWAIAHFFGAGQAADAILLVTGSVLCGASALQVARELQRFAAGVGSARTHADLEQAGRHLARALVLAGITGLTALLFRSRPRSTFREPHFPGPLVLQRPAPRSGGWRYTPTVRQEPLGQGLLGVTTDYGDIVLNAELPATVRLETLRHEQVHQFFTAKLYFLRDVRMTLALQGYNRSHLLRYLEEAVAEGVALLRTQGSGVLAALRFPVQNGYVTVAKLGEEARGILLGPVNAGGTGFRVYLETTRRERGR